MTAQEYQRLSALVEEGWKLFHLDARSVEEDIRLRAIESELRQALWCESCQAGRFADCTKQRPLKTGYRGVCPMEGWSRLLATSPVEATVGAATP